MLDELGVQRWYGRDSPLNLASTISGVRQGGGTDPGDRLVVLLKNERDEWELPGGKLDRGEAPERCVARELEEELAISIRVGPLIDAWLYEVLPGEEVLIVTYGCYPAPFVALTHSAEHKEVGAFAPEAVRNLPMPDGYRRSIERWIAWEGARSPGFPGLAT